MAVEGDLDEVVLQRIVTEVGLLPGSTYGKRGKPYLLGRLGAFNFAARISPWAVLIDLDSDAACAPEFLAARLPSPSRYMCCRIAVREVEAWLMSDREGIASFLRISVSKVPTEPEKLEDPKRFLVNLARGSQSRVVREGMVPPSSSGRVVGPGYNPMLIGFVEDSANGWQLGPAAAASESLNRALNGIKALRR